MNYNLDRFIVAQERDYAIALSEIKSGRKRSHWMWYIFPQISGLGRSLIAKKYEIADLEEARAYMENEYLRNNLIEISKALLCRNDDIGDIMGFPDDLKLCSCMTLFEITAPEVEEFGMVLDKFYDGIRDEKTIQLATNMRDYGLSSDFCEPCKHEKDHYTIRMDITLDRKMSCEEAEKVILNALRSAGMKAHKGGIS